MERSRRSTRRTRWTQALLLAAVSCAALILASPAVAKPVHVIAHGGALSASAAVAVACIAAIAAIALVVIAVLMGRPTGLRSAAAVAHLPRVKHASTRRIAA